MIKIFFDTEDTSCYRKLRDSQKTLFLLGGRIGSGKTSFLKRLVLISKNEDPESLTVFVEVKSEAGQNPQLLNLERLIFTSVLTS